jgi:hypothetical protein
MSYVVQNSAEIDESWNTLLAAAGGDDIGFHVVATAPSAITPRRCLPISLPPRPSLPPVSPKRV